MSDNSNYSSSNAENPRPGPYLAKVIGHQDSTFMGILQVQLLRPVGGSTSETKTFSARYMSPFFGVTSADHVTEQNDYNNTQKSYGMWMVPPDVGSIVIIIFVDGAPDKPYWIGCVPDEGMNFMTPGLAATQKVVEDVDAPPGSDYGRVPVAEYNKVANTTTDTDITQGYKPRHPFTDVLDKQGLLFDDIRGITTSSSRREVPSMVFGISTPGPVDKQSDAKQGKIGTQESSVDAFVSRLGGTTFVMDDGDDRFLRRTTPSEGPPDYASIDNDETDGDPTIPHNELVRIRTRTGHQILLHNSEDLIYITNARGTSWIEFSSDGKIDIYAKDSISVRTENDFNFYADRDFNIEVGRNFNLKVAERHQTEIGTDKICIVNGNVAIQVDGDQDETITGAHAQSFGSTWDVTAKGQTNMTMSAGLDINTTGANKITSSGNMEIGAANTTISGGKINLNGPAAASAGKATAATAPEALTTFQNPTEVEGETLESIMVRIPTTEPYPHHENLDATMFKPDKTDREVEGDISVPDAWQHYSTTIDTFKTIPPVATDQEQEEFGT